jgi:hypothetical protein
MAASIISPVICQEALWNTKYSRDRIVAERNGDRALGGPAVKRDRRKCSWGLVLGSKFFLWLLSKRREPYHEQTALIEEVAGESP